MTYFGYKLTILIKMNGLYPTKVEQLPLVSERPPSIENIGGTCGEHWPRERIGERTSWFPVLEKSQVIALEC